MPESNVGMEETQNEDILVHGNLLLVYANTKLRTMADQTLLLRDGMNCACRFNSLEAMQNYAHEKARLIYLWVWNLVCIAMVPVLSGVVAADCLCMWSLTSGEDLR